MTYCHYTKFRKQTNKQKHLYIKSALTQINLPDSHLDYIIETQCAKTQCAKESSSQGCLCSAHLGAVI